eukprot:scaffold72740_cov76-Phaeocystis_antarctica.AAC.2
MRRCLALASTLLGPTRQESRPDCRADGLVARGAGALSPRLSCAVQHASSMRELRERYAHRALTRLSRGAWVRVSTAARPDCLTCAPAPLLAPCVYDGGRLNPQGRSDWPESASGGLG